MIDAAGDVDGGVSEFYIAATESLVDRPRWTLKHGDTFALFDRYGDITPGGPEGVYHRDTRFLSRSLLTIEGERPLLLGSTIRSDNIVLSVDLTNPDLFRDDRLLLPKNTIHISRSLFLWDACCYERLALRCFTEAPLRLRVALSLGADFADSFEVRGFKRVGRRGAVHREPELPRRLRFDYHSQDGVPRSTQVEFSPAPAVIAAGRAHFDLMLARSCPVVISICIRCRHGMEPKRPTNLLASLRRARAAGADPAGVALETSNPAVNEVLRRSFADLAMLRTETPEGPYPYAGIPWFSTVFGRDGIVTALELLWLEPAVACGVLKVLAATQSAGFDPRRAAEPGKIVHELRDGELARLGEIPFGRYYGSVDATPLFVVLAGAYYARTSDGATIDAIWPQICAALEWLREAGEDYGYGFVAYRGHNQAGGLLNQGWKDSEDAVFHADGRLAAGPIALVEVQGYVYAAWRAAAGLARSQGDTRQAVDCEERAQGVRDRFEALYWCEDIGTYALALDGEQRPCRVRSSNPGHLLLCGLPSAERAARVAASMFNRSLFSGWGIRTLHEAEVRYNPASYHNGSVWPHDNALIALGLRGYRQFAGVLRLTQVLFEAADAMPLRRLPELFCGFRRRRGQGPTAYPVACSPQAWAAGAPIALLQACLNFSFDAERRVVRMIHPRLPDSIDWMRVSRLPVGDAHIDLLLRRHGNDASVNVLQRSHDVQVELVS